MRLPTWPSGARHPHPHRLFLKQFSAQHGKHIQGVSPAARHKLPSCPWPGNVRQLRNVVESMVVVDYDGLLDVDDLPEELAAPAEPVGEPATASLVGWSATPRRRSSGCSSPRPCTSAAAIAKWPPASWGSASGRCIGRSRSMGCKRKRFGNWKHQYD